MHVWIAICHKGLRPRRVLVYANDERKAERLALEKVGGFCEVELLPVEQGSSTPLAVNIGLDDFDVPDSFAGGRALS